jgi:membrane-bound lytic murein transglycosylase B
MIDATRTGVPMRGLRAALLALPLAVLLVSGAGARGPGDSPFTPGELEPLLQSLQEQGLPRPLLNDIFYDGRLRKTRAAIALNSVNPDNAVLYAQYSEPFAIRLAQRFKQRHLQLLNRAEREYGVPVNIITAVLLVETQFGTYPLRYRVLEVYTTLVVDSNEAAIRRHYERIREQYPEVDRDYFATRVASKAQWAYDQLVALLSMGRPDPKRLYEIKGSYAGAFGMPQFLPSSYLRFAVDGDQDGAINLDHTADAIASTANYLRAHGWRRGASLDEKMRAVWLYNRSLHYVRAIFDISRRMSIPPRKPVPPRDAFTASADTNDSG